MEIMNFTEMDIMEIMIITETAVLDLLIPEDMPKGEDMLEETNT